MIELPNLTAAEAMQPQALARKGVVVQEELTRVQKGQILILFALFLTAMLGVLGLSMDVGYLASQRRMMQNAADLAAIAGALSVANYSSTNQISSMTAVQHTIDGNQTHEGSPALEKCDYINDGLASVSSCDGFVPAAATGISIRVRETHKTFFIKVVPGGPSEVTTRATASARVERLFRGGMDSPFIVCGWDTMKLDGSTESILTDNTTVNPNALGDSFRLTGTGDAISRCGIETSGSAWRGLAQNQDSSPNNIGNELNSYWLTKNGSSPGSVKNNVAGLNGCTAGTAAPFGSCVMLIPVATDAAHDHGRVKVGGDYKLYVVKVLGFLVTSCGGGCYQGTLLDDYPTFGASVTGWTRDTGAVTVVKLQKV